MAAKSNSPKRTATSRQSSLKKPFAKAAKKKAKPDTDRVKLAETPAPESTQADRPAGKRATRKKKATKAAAKRRNLSDERPAAGTAAAVPGQPERAPIVALGASAGGLQAFEEFFANVPPDSGLIFVVISHQDPTRASLLPELLEKSASIPVVVISDGVQPKPNQIHVAPPGSNVAMLNSTFQLMEPSHARGVALPIDHLFRSLAEDQRGNAICVILSGNGTDGTLGLRAIKAGSGLAIVQEPGTATFTGMPESALATGLADYVLSPAEMPEQLMRYVRSPHRTAPEDHEDEGFEQTLRKVLILVRGRTGHDFSSYKPTTIRRRVERRMSVHQIKDPQHYVRYLERNPQETGILFRELLISVTTFFRDADAFDALKRVALPELLASKPDDHILRAWVPGCATGEEAYSVAIILRECADELQRHFNVQIFGTDLDDRAIDVARTGLYPDGIAADVGPKRLERFFIREGNGYRISKDVRQSVVFASQSLIADPPFTKMDMISCRNLLIYLNAELQRRLIPQFHYAIRPGGLLMLGTSESIGTFTGLFAPVDKKWKIYARKPAAIAAPGLAGPPAAAPEVQPNTAAPGITDQGCIKSPSDAVAQFLLTRFAPPSVIVDERGDIHHIHGRTGKYLEPAPGRPTSNILKMAREGLQIELSAALQRVAKQRSGVSRKHIRVTTNGGHEYVNLAVSRIARPEALKGLFLVAFEPPPEPPPVAPARRKRRGALDSKDRVGELERELEHTKQTLQGTIEESDTINEELKSTNEELQSTNEELQSANEELETSKEEMQSLNEELQTVNAELQGKLDELSRTNDDLANLLNSTEIATVFLDADLRIQRFTKQARRLIKLIETDVGRSVGDLASNLSAEDLEADAAEVLDTLNPTEREVQTAEGDWFLMRIAPYRTTHNVIKGLVMTFVDIAGIKVAQAAKRELQLAWAYAEGLAETIREPFLLLDGDMRIIRANRSFYERFRVDATSTEGQRIYDVGNRQWDIPALRQMLEKVLPKRAAVSDFDVEHEFPTIGRKKMRLNARRLKRDGDPPELIFLSVEDVTDNS